MAGSRKAARDEIQRVPFSAMPPPGTILCKCGWWVSADPHVRKTAVMPTRAPSSLRRQAGAWLVKSCCEACRRQWTRLNHSWASVTRPHHCSCHLPASPAPDGPVRPRRQVRADGNCVVSLLARSAGMVHVAVSRSSSSHFIPATPAHSSTPYRLAGEQFRNCLRDRTEKRLCEKPFGETENSRNLSLSFLRLCQLSGPFVMALRIN